MSIDDWQKIAQIAFYVTGGLVAVLTYIKAKNGLLNSVNTEYKKRVMDRLAEVSSDLLSEYDPESPKHWTRVDSVKEVLGRLHERCRDHKDEIIKSGGFFPGIPISTRERELYRAAQIIRSDPFIPRILRTKILDFFEGRAEVMSTVYVEAIEQYQNDLKSGKYWDSLDTNHYWLHNKILEKMNDRGCGISQIEEEVHRLRNSIQDYFEQFDPIK